ncbi:MAG: hypothetical protein AAGH19_06395 [Pseudomonadota bacterium]
MLHRAFQPVLLLALLAATAFAAAGASEAESDAEAQRAAMLAHVPELPRAAILRFVETDLARWHYVRTRTSDDGVTIDRHDPTLPREERWQLVSIDGREPTEKELRRYRRDREDAAERDEQERDDELVKVLQPGSIQFLGEENGFQRFSYALQSPDGKREKVYAALEGELLIDPDDGGRPWVREVRVWNRETLRPFIGVRIDDAHMSFTFELKDDWVLPVAVDVRWAGEILALRDVGNAMSYRLEDFRHADDVTAAIAALSGARPSEAAP